MIASPDVEISGAPPRFRATNAPMLAFLLLVALVLRAPGLTFGLPGYMHDDEHTVLGMVANMAGAFNPHDFRWPATPQVAITAIVTVAYLFGGLLTGKYRSIEAVRAAFWSEADSMVVVARLVVLCAALVTLAVLYWLFRHRNPRLGLAAVAVLAVLPLHVRNSTYALPDIPATLLLTLAVVISVLSIERPSARGFFLSGLAAGLGAAVKYYDVSGCAAVAAAALLTAERPIAKLRLIAWGASGAVAGFLIGCPYLLLVPREFAASLAGELAHQRAGQIGNEPEGNHVAWYLREVLAPAMTPPVLLLGAVGAGLALWRQDRWLGPVIAVIVAYSLLAISSRTSFDRYALPVLPLFAALSAYAVFVVPAMLSRQAGSRAVLSAILLAALLALPLSRSIGISSELFGVESRIKASAWMQSHVPVAAAFVRTPYAPHLKGAATFRFSQPVPDELSVRVMRGDFEWAAVDSWTMERIAVPTARQGYPAVVDTQEALVREIQRRGRLVATFGGARQAQSPTVWIYELKPGE